MSDKRAALYERVTAWNKERNGLKLDMSLEMKMAGEEAMEVFTANNKAERLREIADFHFVCMGTAAKLEANAPDYRNDSVESLIGGFFETMDDVLEADGTEDLLLDALEIICDANDWKPKDPTTGKVIKGDFYIDPIGQIEELIECQQ